MTDLVRAKGMSPAALVGCDDIPAAITAVANRETTGRAVVQA